MVSILISSSLRSKLWGGVSDGGPKLKADVDCIFSVVSYSDLKEGSDRLVIRFDDVEVHAKREGAA